MNEREALKLALVVLKAKDAWGASIREAKEKAIAAAEEVLAQPEPKPVAWKTDDIELYVREDKFGFYNIPLYTTPPQRTWVGLTDEDRKPLIQQAMMYYGHKKEYWLQTSGAGFCLLVQAIEAKLKEKNT